MRRGSIFVALGFLALLPEAETCTVDPQYPRPTNLTRTAYNANPRQLTLSWQDNTIDEVGFFVEMSGDGGLTWALVSASGANSNTFLVSWTGTARLPYFRVTATSMSAFSFPSNIISIEGTDPTTADTDGDGMLDAFEVTNDLDPYEDDAYEDADGDRYPNIFEYARGTDVNDQASRPPADYVVDGNSPPSGNRFATVQAALGQVAEDYRIVSVRAGTYAGFGNVDLATSATHALLLIGEEGAGATVLDGRSESRLLTARGETTVDGLSFRNGAASDGGAVLVEGGDLLMVNCVFTGNHAVHNGGALYQAAGSTLLIHSTFLNNTAGNEGDAVYVAQGALGIDKSILWSTGLATPVVTSGTAASVEATESIVQGGFTGSGNLNADPLIRLDGHLRGDSPAINSGGILATALMDMDGESRPAGSTTDIGADEWVDTDNDGLADWWELVHMGGLAQGPGGDRDGDGLTESQEYTLGSNPDLSDSDGDGMLDGWEADNGLDSLTADANGNPDGDLFSNFQEYRLGMNPNEADLRTAIKTGDTNLILLRADGTVWAWGANDKGQLGNGTVDEIRESRVPVQVSGLTGIIEIAAGSGHCLALKNDGTVWAWGEGWSGQLGDNQWASSDIPVQVSGIGEVIGIAAGEGFSFALGSDGTVWGWGTNWTNQLGDGSWTSTGHPQHIPGLTDVVAISAGQAFGLALREDGTVWGWGANWTGQLGDGTSTGRDVPAQVAGNQTSITKISAGYAHALAIKNDGSILGWGANWDGALGNDTTYTSLEPIAVGTLTDIVEVSAGQSHNLARKSNGTVYAWGSNAIGQLGTGTASYLPVLAPELVANVMNVTTIAASTQPFSAAIGANGEVWVWGSNWFGELADGIPTHSDRPIELGTPNAAVSVSAGNMEAFILRGDGTVWSWGGLDENGKAKSDPAQVPGLAGIRQLASGAFHNLALRDDQTLLAWGENFYGQLGDGSTTSSYVPVAVSGGMDSSPVGKIACGEYHSLTLNGNGLMYSWGHNSEGQVGYGGGYGTGLSPSQVQFAPVFVQIGEIATGARHNLALSLDGAVWTWGRGNEGQLGNGHLTTPVAIKVSGSNLAQGVICIAAGERHSLALKKDGRVWAWGDNDGGLLGIGIGTGTFGSPLRISGLAGVIGIAAAGDHSFAMKRDGSVWAWGQNWAGQLGIGTRESQNSPVRIPDLEGVKSIAVGYDFAVALKYDGSVSTWGSGYFGHLANGLRTTAPSPSRVPDINALHPLQAVVLSRTHAAAPVLPGSPVGLEIATEVPSSTIAKVEYFSDQTKIGESSVAPWGLEWTPQTWGKFNLKARVTDTAGNLMTSNVLDVSASADRDLDELPDWWELRSFGDLEETAQGDSDADGLNNLAEYQTGTHPGNSDTDGDGERDGEESFPQDDPNALDSDVDGMTDSYEIANGLNPYADDGLYDQDGDGVPNQWEFAKGTAAADRRDLPAWDWIVDAVNSGTSTVDNVVASIQMAVNNVPAESENAAHSCQTILVKGSAHAENVVLPENKRIALVAEKGRKVVKLVGGEGNSTILDIRGRSVVEGFWITPAKPVLHGDGPSRLPVNVQVPAWQSCRIGNTVISGHKNGVAVACQVGGDLILDHCTIFGNRADAVWSYAGNVLLEGCILWNPLANQEILGGIRAATNIIRGGSNGGIDQDPLLRKDGTLSAESPAREAGSDRRGPGGDIHGEIRPTGAARDLGADEWVDSDDDGLVDFWEWRHFGNLDALGNADPDNDGVSNLEESGAEADPNNADSDADGLGDREELNAGMDPASSDSDGDGMPDGYEVTHGLNALSDDKLFDRDGDGVPNLWEAERGTSASDKTSTPAWDWIVDPEQANASDADNIASTINEALFFGGENALIYVKAGFYFEDIEMEARKTVALIAERGTGRRVRLFSTGGTRPLRLLGTGVVDGFEITRLPAHVQPAQQPGCAVRTEGHWRLANCLISGHRQDSPVVSAVDRLILEHSAIFLNVGSPVYVQCDEATVLLKNSILWNDPGAGAKEISENADVETIGSIIRGGQYGALDADPLLWKNGALRSGSPAINLNPGQPSGDGDIDGEIRPFGGACDSGADELVDNDNDSLGDWWELKYFENLEQDGSGDPDADGLTTNAEFAAHSNPNHADPDNDQLSDAFEVANGLDPLNADSDRDGMGDKYELDHGLNPRLDDTTADHDNDQLPNGFEARSLGLLDPSVANDPAGDSDNDGVGNLYEAIYSLDPTKDDGSVDIDNDGLSGAEEYIFGSSPVNADIDGDGLNDSQEKSLGTKAWHSDSEGEVFIAQGTTPGDGLPDGWEVQHGLNPLQWDDPDSDADQDGLPLALEYRNGTNPALSDSDGDGTNDGTEVAEKTSPNDPSWGGPDDSSDTVEAAFFIGSEGKQLTKSCAVCHWLDVKIDGRLYRDGEIVTLKKGQPYDITVVDSPKPLPPGAAASHHPTAYTARFTVYPKAVNGQTITEAPGEEGQPPKAFFVQKDEVLQYLIDNSEGLLVQNKPWPKDPAEEPTKKKAQIVPVEIVPDFNRDGIIDEKDRGKVTKEKPWRFWINDDDDWGDAVGDDIPGVQVGVLDSVYLGPDYQEHANDSPGRVDGTRDLVDFFPLFLDIKKLTELMPPEEYGFYLRHDESALNVVETNLNPASDSNLNIGAYLRDINTARTLGNSSSYQIKNEGIQLSAEMLSRIIGGSGVILVEARKKTVLPLVLEIRKREGDVVSRLEFQIGISGVEAMFRMKNMVMEADVGNPDIPAYVEAKKVKETVGSRIFQPDNYPDELCSDDWFFFIHGCCTSQYGARGWHSEVFKRLFWSGLKAKFVGITWRGDESTGDYRPVTDGTPNYHQNVIYAFATGRALAGFVNGLPGRKVVAAHSLGNMVAAAAINDGKMNVHAYYMTDAAIPIEAFGSYQRASSRSTFDRGAVERAMTHPNFEYYPPKVQSTNWYDLFFDYASSDPRARLTWKGRFSDVLSSTRVYNYYSSGEEVLENGDGDVPEVDWNFIMPSSGVWGGVKIWAMQEMQKGIAFPVPGLNPYNVHGGWGRSDRSVLAMEEGDFLELPEYTLISWPFFKDFRLPVHGIMDDNGPIAKEVASQYMGRATLLAEAIPALSFAAGSNPLEFGDSDLPSGSNIDLNTDMRPPGGFWPVRERVHAALWDRWLHGDLKDVSYLYTFRLFDDWVEKSR